MQKIKILTDSASDLPYELAGELGVTVLPIPITHAGRAFSERVELTNEQFYDLLLSSNEIPTTSHITADTYMQEYKKAYDEGYTHLLNITINSHGSNMFNAACLARQRFYEEYGIDIAGFRIEVVDSKTYTMAYGIAVVKAARMARDGQEIDVIIPFLLDWFDRLEILFSVYSLDHVKRSGRVSCAAAFVGELLGLRPLITFVGGDPAVIGKVRGDKNVVPKLLETAKNRMENAKDYPFLMICGTPKEEAKELEKLIRDTMPEMPFEGVFPVGASVSINCGPKVLALVYAGKKRS